jgi:hypothetical protein
MQWDHEVDVMCIGSEGGALAAGVIAVSAGLDAFVGISSVPAVQGDLAASLTSEDPDEQTTAYLDGFNYAFGRGDRARVDLPVRTVEDVAPPKRGPRDRGAVVPFYGALLEPWAYQCAAASYGVLYNRTSMRQMTEMPCGPGETVEAAVVGSFALSPGKPSSSMTTWLRNRASSVGLRPRIGVRLVRLIFEENKVVGAVLNTPQGSQTVRARQNVVIGVGNPLAEGMQPVVTGTESATVHVCLVSKLASRFGQLELVLADGLADRISFLPAPNAKHYSDSIRAVGF